MSKGKAIGCLNRGCQDMYIAGRYVASSIQEMYISTYGMN